MLLDLSGLTREERVMLQASGNNERDFDRVAEALNIQHARFYLRESQRRTKGDGSKRGDTSNTSRFRGKGKGKHTSSGKSGARAYHANFTSVDDYDDDVVEPGDACQAHNDPVDPGSDDGDEALDDDDDDDEENDTFSWYVALVGVTVLKAAGLDATALLAETWDNNLDPEVSAQLVQASAHAYLSLG